MLQRILKQFSNSYRTSPFEIHAKVKQPEWLDHTVRGFNAPLVWVTQVLPNRISSPLLQLIPGGASILYRGLIMTLKTFGNLLKHVVWCAVGLVFTAYYLVRSIVSLGQNQYYNKNLFDILYADVIQSLMALPVCVLDGVYGLLVMIGDEISQIINHKVNDSNGAPLTPMKNDTNPLGSSNVSPAAKRDNVKGSQHPSNDDQSRLFTPQKKKGTESKQTETPWSGKYSMADEVVL